MINITLGNGKFNQGHFIPGNKYGFGQGNAHYNPVGIASVLEKLWQQGAFWYNNDEVRDARVTITVQRLKGKLVNQDEMIIIRQLQAISRLANFDYIIEIENLEDEDLVILDYSIQKCAGK